MTAFARRLQSVKKSTPVVPSGHRYITAVSANHRYFVDQHGSPIMIRGDSPWTMMTRLSPADVDLYLARCVNYGINSLIVSLIGSTGSGISDDGATYDGLLPFNSGNITSFNSAYWNRMDLYVAKARDAGMTLFLYPMDGWNTKTGTLFRNKSTGQCQTYGQMVAARYASYPNIFWMYGGDYGALDGVDDQFRACQAGIRSTGDVRPFSVQMNSYVQLTSDYDWTNYADANFCYTYEATYAVVLAGYNAVWDTSLGLPATRPAFFGEGGYDGNESMGGSAAGQRKQQCWSLTSGACGTFTGQEGVWDFVNGWESLIDSTQIHQTQKIQETLLALPEWHLLVPDQANALVTAGRGTRVTYTPETIETDVYNSDYVTAAVTPDKTLAVIYNPNTSTRNITISAAAVGSNPTLRRVDPKTGVSTAMTWTTNPTAGVNAAGDRDWLFIIEAS